MRTCDRIGVETMNVYVHIPFCRRICTYCDFPREMAKEPKRRRYVKALLREAEIQRTRLSSARTLHLGGGTPSELGMKLLGELLDELSGMMPLLEEIAVEVNPEDIDESFCRQLADTPINRVNLGVQSFDEEQLCRLGRGHSPSQVEQVFARLRQSGFDNIGIDLLFGLPSQTLGAFKQDLQRAVALGPDHLACYHLTLEAGTRLYRLWRQEALMDLPGEEAAAEMYELARDWLPAEGFEQYEISNFTRNRPSLHNLAVWRGEDYLGLGAAAHSRLNGIRYANVRSVKRYIEAVESGGNTSCVESAEAAKDDLLLGLRLREGVDMETFKARHGTELFSFSPRLKEALAAGLLEVRDNRVRLSERGQLLGNEVFARV